MATVRELYELWAGESELGDALNRSLEPRGLDFLFDAFAAARGGLLWGIYQLLGKLCPTVYVWTSST